MSYYSCGQPRGTFVHLFSVSRKRDKSVPIYSRLLCKSVTCYHSKKDALFPHRCANPQLVDRNGQQDNEWKKRENGCYLKILRMLRFFVNARGLWKFNQ